MDYQRRFSPALSLGIARDQLNETFIWALGCRAGGAG